MIEEVSLGMKLLGLLKRFWPYIAVALLIAGGFVWHGHAVHKAIAAAEQRGEAREAERVRVRVEQITRKQNEITAKIRSENDETNRHIAADADDLRLRGPGKAVCPYPPAAAPVRSGPSAGPADAAVAPVLNPGGPVLVAVSFNDLILFAEQHDKLLAAVRATVEQHERLVAAQPAIPSQPKEQDQ
jgi:hypothetical protein